MEQFSIEKYLKNPDRKIMTRVGCKARVICINRRSESFPVVALVQKEAIENTYCYTRNGLCSGDTEGPNDLFFVPIKKEGWMNIYKNYKANSSIVPGGAIYNTKEEAKIAAEDNSTYISTVKIEWEE